MGTLSNFPTQPRMSSSSQASTHDKVGGGGDGGGGNMNERLTRIETVAANQEKLIDDIRLDMRGIRDDIHGLERRIVDKMDENHKWVIGLIISSILVPLLIALVTK